MVQAYLEPEADMVLCFVSELDVRCEACQRFFKEGLTTSFIKILTDEAVSGWKMEIHVSVVANAASILFFSVFCLVFLERFKETCRDTL